MDTLMQTGDQPLEWARRNVMGVAWDSEGGEFSIVAQRCGSGPVLCLQRFDLIQGKYPTLEAAQGAAEKLRRQGTVAAKAATR